MAAALARLCGVRSDADHEHGQNRGLIERTPHEWHKNVLETRLTTEGQAVMADADARGTGRAGLVAECRYEEREALVGLLGRCVELLEKEML